MPQLAKPPRLYLDPKRQTWAIRYKGQFIRTPYKLDQLAAAKDKLDELTGRLAWIRWGRLRQYGKKPPQPKRRTLLGSIYFISKEGCDIYPIKIGFAGTRFKRRISDIQTGNPEPLAILVQHPGTYEDEQRIHRRLTSFRVLGEWFSRAEEVMEAVAMAREGRLLEWLNACSPFILFNPVPSPSDSLIESDGW